MSMPWHGIEHRIRTRSGVRAINARIETNVLQTLVDVFEDTGDYRAASTAAGVSRRMGHTYLDKLGLIERDPGKQRTHTEYTFEPTEKTVRTLYPWGTIHRAVQLYWQQEMGTREVAEEVDVPDYTVWNWMNELGIARERGLQHKISTAKRVGFDFREGLEAEVRRLRTFDTTVEEIAFRLGISRRLVSSILPGSQKRDPVKMREKSRERRVECGKPAYAYRPGHSNEAAVSERRERVAAMRDEGVKPLAIAHELEVSVATVYHDLKAA